MTYVIVEPCIGEKNSSCVDVCPVSCIYESDDMYYINPDECIECGACEPECPVNAIFHDSAVPDEWKPFIQRNRELSSETVAEIKPSFTPRRDAASVSSGQTSSLLKTSAVGCSASSTALTSAARSSGR